MNTTTVLRLLIAVMLGVAAAVGWQMYVAREARLAGHAVPPPSGAAAGDARPATVKLHRCVDAAGSASIQSDPCPAGSRTTWVREATPEAGDEPATVIDGRPATSDAPAPGAQPVTFACEMALANRKAYRAGELGAIDDDGLALHDETVAQACG